ncbi:nucleoside hydrolase [Rhizobium redzepovicii]|uniref:nucleoside hydrolase n=1 Tax=Rhizobium redzepovicii TaxID=2867518 RepID=UPI002872073A|nr:nucleoside hydrolase [Rhizobium redzepovicii]MDR9781727.1 nucleoside hydrolase [Rhizobium redzepovicii]
MSKQSIIIDTDPGQDDALAILMALANNELLEVLGITAVCGNIGVRATAANALKVLRLAGREDVPVFVGAAAPILGGLVTAEALHGAAITEGWDLPTSTTHPRPEFAADWIIDTVNSHPPGTITICALGPLTNVALAIAKCPEIAGRLHGLVLMAGASQGGNMNAVAEFNVFVDAYAAARVFAAPVPKTVVSLDITSKLLLTERELNRLTSANNAITPRLKGLLTLYENYIKLGKPRPVHDPAVIAWLLAPEMFVGKDVNVEIDTTRGLTHGQTIVDMNGVTGRAANAFWLTAVDNDTFYGLLAQALEETGRRSLSRIGDGR